MKRPVVVDLFCGGGGESCGIKAAYASRGFDIELHAVNHWQRAIETHAENHPDARHYCEPVQNIDPVSAVPGGRCDLLWASPECTHHSTARGGRPRTNQGRVSAWLILKWLQELYVPRVIVENVPEFLNWGPLDSRGRPMKSRAGETFRAWVSALQSLGYTVDWRVLCSADYGAPTIRKRLFIQAVRGRKRILWPEQSHAPAGDMLCRPWRTAREIIDWTLTGRSIFGRKKPLAPATIDRIAHGIEKYWGEWAEPFLVVLRGASNARDLAHPLPAVTSGGKHLGLVQPFITQSEHGLRVEHVDSPMRTITCSSRGFGLVEPFMMGIDHRSDKSPVAPMDVPLSTITTKARHGIVEPFILHQDAPGSPRSLDAPCPSVRTRNGHGLVSPFLVKYFGTARARPVDEPLDSVTTKDRFALVEGSPIYLDIRFRMLQPHELAAAQGFSSDYSFLGTKTEQVRQIGNAVPPPVAEALVGTA